MCGIFGYLGPDAAGLDVRLARMLARLRHRGPDGTGVWTEPLADGGAIGLGHVRLSIIDLAGGAQPFASGDGRYQISFNGEIYNYLEIRAELASLGRRFRTTSDTEVLVEAYAEWGQACLSRLNGMFAVAIWDRLEARLFLARDPLGEKPLLYARLGAGLVFASEIAGLVAGLDAAPPVDPRAIADYLVFKYVPDGRTMLAGVRALPAGCFAVADRAGLRIERYYAPPRHSGAAGPLTDAHGAEALALFEDAVRLRLRADVPVGLFLSGGIDSSLVLAVATRLAGRPLDTLSIDFQDGEEAYSEAWAAERVAAAAGSRHATLRIGPGDFVAGIDAATAHRGQPLSEIADVAMFRLSRFARERVSVVLSGQAADEVFAGYPRYWGEAVAAGWQRRLPRRADPLVGAVERRLPYRARRAAILLRALTERRFVARQAAWFGAMPLVEAARLAPDLYASHDPFDLSDAGAEDDPVQRALAFDRAVWLPDNILARDDRMTMAAPVELRIPFLDTRLLALAARLPPAAFLGRGGGKPILRCIARGLLPDEIVARPKSGFRVPFHEWLRGPMRLLAEERLLDPGAAIAGILDIGVVRRLLAEHLSRRRNHEKPLWAILSLEIWLRQQRA